MTLESIVRKGIIQFLEKINFARRKLNSFFGSEIKDCLRVSVLCAVV